MADLKSNKKKGLSEEQRKKFNIIFVIAIAVIIIGGFAIFKINQAKTKERIKTSYLLSNGIIDLKIKDLQEASQLVNSNKNKYFVLINYSNNLETYKLEEGLKDIINNNKWKNIFYYFNVTDIMNDTNFLDNLNNAFKTDKIKKVPAILYFNNNELVDIVDRDDNNIIKAADFQKLIDIYDIEG